MVPTGVPELGETALTVAVKVTWSDPGATAEEWTAVEVSALFTVCTKVPVLVRKLVLPLYRALIACEATESEAVAQLACPLPLSAKLVQPVIGMALSVKLTVPP